MVRLKPESAMRVGQGLMSELFDAAVSVGDVFGPTEASFLFEKLAGAKDSVGRVMAVQDFLLRRLRDDEPDPAMRQAMLSLRRNSTLSVRQLAMQLDLSERHLSRQFRAATGATPKQFARIVRIGKVVATARPHRQSWAEIAVSCGFTDQAHMVNEFRTMIGSSPEAFFHMTSLRVRPPMTASSAESDFYNTFVLEQDRSGRLDEAF
jgi:AraC-like DNA-binding protein